MRGDDILRQLRAWRPAVQGMLRTARLQTRLLVATLVLLAAPALAEVPLPVVPQASGQCLDTPDAMRRNHMDMLRHTRDDTMRQGVRVASKGLKDCVTCHAVKGADDKPVTIADPQHFCRSCHAYVGVKPDCFQCHSSVPEANR